IVFEIHYIPIHWNFQKAVRLIKMRFSISLALYAALLSPVRATPVLKRLEQRAAPLACAKPFAVSLAYDVVSALHASSFCSSWLHISTQTAFSKVHDRCN